MHSLRHVMLEFARPRCFPRQRSLLTAATAACLAVSACTDSSLPLAPGPAARADGAVKEWESNSAVYWNEQATDLTALRAIDAIRMYAYLGLAQFRAAESAAVGTQAHPPVSAAIGGASAAVLESFFPADAVTIEAALAAQEAADPWPGEKHADFRGGVAMGRGIGAQVLAWAQGDRVGLQNPGTPPIGPGYWKWNGGPIARGNLGARPFFLDSGDELQPPPPPAFGSPEYLTALAEVRQISDTRTPEQLAIAQFWAVNQSPRSNAAMYGVARELLVKYRVRETESARILFLAGAATFDALVGCFNAKYHYWFIRPPQADPLITLPIGLPPHPSYPSSHACVSGAMTTVLADAFPSERDRLQALAREASLSRLYAGIHYRFDMEAGLKLGAGAAQKALHADPDAIDITP